MPFIDSKSRQILPPETYTNFTVNGGDFFRTHPDSPHYLLRNGLVIVYAQYASAYASRDSVCLGLYSPYSLLGRPLGQDNLPYSRKVRAVSNSVFQAIPREGSITNPVAKALITEASDHDKRIQEERINLLTSAAHIREKIAWLLLALTKPGKREIPIGQQVIADLTGSTRPTTNTALRGLERSGVLSTNSATYKIIEPTGVEKLKTIVRRMNPDLLPE